VTVFSQQKFDASLGKRIEKMEESQMSSSATLDSTLHRIHTDMHQIAGNLLDILIRLEDRLDSIADRASCDAVQKAHPAAGRVCKKSFAGRGDGSDLDGFNSHRLGKGAWQQAESSRILGRDLDFVQTQNAVPGKRGSGQGTSKKLATRSSSLPAGSAIWMQDENREKIEGFSSSSTLPLEPARTPVDVLSEFKSFNTKFGSLVKKVELIAISMGIHGVSSEFDHEEDRKRLKEKLKQAIEIDRRSRIHTIVSHAEAWLEYVFGICQPDQRLGKRGSR
jgi:hypothetical protein